VLRQQQQQPQPRLDPALRPTNALLIADG